MKCRSLMRLFWVSLSGLFLWAALLFTFCTQADASPLTPDLLLLRDVICEKESRTVKTPERAVRHRVKRGSDGQIIRASTDLGFCQINVLMLEDMGFLASLGKAAYRDARMIFTREGSKSIALEILAQRAADFPTASERCLYIKYRWGKQVKCNKNLLQDEDVAEVTRMYQQRKQQTAMR